MVNVINDAFSSWQNEAMQAHQQLHKAYDYIPTPFISNTPPPPNPPAFSPINYAYSTELTALKAQPADHLHVNIDQHNTAPVAKLIPSLPHTQKQASGPDAPLL